MEKRFTAIFPTKELNPYSCHSTTSVPIFSWINTHQTVLVCLSTSSLVKTNAHFWDFVCFFFCFTLSCLYCLYICLLCHHLSTLQTFANISWHISISWPECTFLIHAFGCLHWQSVKVLSCYTLHTGRSKLKIVYLVALHLLENGKGISDMIMR